MDPEQLRRSFGAVAAAYDAGRPGFPRKAAAWLAGESPTTVLELGAGTGKLTAELVALGHDVQATDPDPDMLELLVERLPAVRTSRASAENLPLPDQSVDVVVAAQAFHWFDPAAALPEIARVLRPGGRLALVWNFFDTRIAWVRRFAALLGGADVLGVDALGSVAFVEESPLFGPIESDRFEHWQLLNRNNVRDLALSRSYISTLDPDDREAKLVAVREFYDDFGRGVDGMQLPYFANCFRATVDESAHRAPEPEPEREDAASPRAATGPDDDLLLIDFR